MRSAGLARREPLAEQGGGAADVRGGVAGRLALLREDAVAPGPEGRGDVVARGGDVDVGAVDRVLGDDVGPVVAATPRTPGLAAG